MKILHTTLLATAAIAMVACDSPQQQAEYQALQNAQQHAFYVPRHPVDADNYDKRQKMTDNPSMIIWCTSFPPTPGVKPITTPIIGKLTSGGKRPTNTEPGPDAMYGSSAPYRYGFTPGNAMVEIENIATICTTAPTTWQKMNTVMMMGQDSALSAAQKSAEASLARNPQDSTEAYRVLQNAIASQPGQ